MWNSGWQLSLIIEWNFLYRTVRLQLSSHLGHEPIWPDNWSNWISSCFSYPAKWAHDQGGWITEASLYDTKSSTQLWETIAIHYFTYFKKLRVKEVVRCFTHQHTQIATSPVLLWVPWSCTITNIGINIPCTKNYKYKLWFGLLEFFKIFVSFPYFSFCSGHCNYPRRM